MKFLKYLHCEKINRGTEADPVIEEVCAPVIMGWNEINEQIAKCEARGGEYTIEDDGQPDPVTETERITELEAALELLLSGVTE